MEVALAGLKIDQHLTPVRATAWAGFGAAVSLFLGVIAMKAYALLVGPEGVGLIGLMQALVNLVVIIAGLGVSTSAVSAISAAIAIGDVGRHEGLRRATMLVPVLGGSLVAAVLVLLREPLAGLVLGNVERTNDIVLVAVAVVCSAFALANVAVLTGRREVIAVSVVTALTGLGAASLGITAVWAFGMGGLAPAVLTGASVHVAFAWWLQRLSHASVPLGTARQRTTDAARDLVRVGMPIAASHLAGTGAMLAAPVLVLHLLGPAEVGFYRAAAAISIGYLAVFVAALTQDYLPRIAGARDLDDLAEMVERQMRLILGLSVPVILGLLAAGPFVVHLLYSPEFAPSFEVLKWQLVGDLVRIPAWIIAFVLLAGRRSKAYFVAELTVGAGLLIAMWISVGALGLAGAGVAYAAAQLAYYAVVWLLVRRNLPTSPGRLQVATLATAAVTAVILVVSPPEPIRAGVFAAGAVGMAALAWPRLYRRYRSGEL